MPEIHHEREWEGPESFEFSRYTDDHTNTVRYRCKLNKRYFDLYVPRFMLEEMNVGEAPHKLKVVIGKGSDGVFDYSIGEKMENSIRYNMWHEGQCYALYVPNEVFGGDRPPPSVYIRIDAVA
jgi:hypothetical protein